MNPHPNRPKGGPMKKHAFVAAIMLSFFVALAVTSARAQSARTFSLEIPFDFVVKGKLMPAGRYTLGRLNASEPSVLLIKSADGRRLRTFSTQRAEASGVGTESMLLFNQYGGQYFLAQVRVAGEMNVRQVPSSSDELELRRSGVEPILALVTDRMATKR